MADLESVVANRKVLGIRKWTKSSVFKCLPAKCSVYFVNYIDSIPEHRIASKCRQQDDVQGWRSDECELYRFRRATSYTILATTNLASTNWTTLLTTNPASLPFTFVDTNRLMQRFYRVRNP